MKKWRIEDSEELYNIKGWGVNYFGINEKGHVYVTPKKNCIQVDLKEVVDQLATRHVTAPVLLPFPDILDNRIEKTDECFRNAYQKAAARINESCDNSRGKCHPILALKGLPCFCS